MVDNRRRSCFFKIKKKVIIKHSNSRTHGPETKQRGWEDIYISLGQNYMVQMIYSLLQVKENVPPSS
jgi:hypothetical protein